MTALLLALVTTMPVSALATAAPPPVPDSLDSWADVILAHVEAHPTMGMDDLYKLLHQGALGSEHAVPDEAQVRQWLEEELAVMGHAPAPEALVDTIAPGGVHVRVNLRPFVERGGDPEALLAAFIQTANAGTHSLGALQEALAEAVALAEAQALPWDAQRLARYFQLQADSGYPAEHHSRPYWSLYRPAYRVVAGALLPELLEALEPAPGT